jgi:hypothetical protein
MEFFSSLAREQMFERWRVNQVRRNFRFVAKKLKNLWHSFKLAHARDGVLHRSFLAAWS